MRPKKIATAERQQRERTGRQAARAAVWLLRFKGYRILARRYRVAVGEIDIVAKRGRTVAFIEVKARATEAAALESVTVRQQRRIARAALVFLQKNPAHGNCDLRFDVITVTQRKWPRQHLDAWRESGGGAQ
jgi:putative endonuclease